MNADPESQKHSRNFEDKISRLLEKRRTEINEEPNDNEDFPLDSSSHLIHHCPTFRKNLLNKDLSKDEDIVSFFTEIIKHRTENNED